MTERTVAQAWAATQPDVCSQHGSEINYAHLDPGIRKVVRQLRAWGFETCDSGDGESKLALPDWTDEDVIPVPHVYMTASPAYLSAEARRLLTLLEGLDLTITEIGQEGSGIWIEATYDPKSDIATIGLHGLADKDLP